MIYLDPAAVVKLVHAEAESAALRGWLDERAETGWISSVLTEIESFRALARYAPDVVSRLPAVLDQIELISLDPPIRILALARDIGTPKEEADALDGIGRCHIQAGNIATGGTYLRQALEIYRRLRSPDVQRVEKTLSDHGIRRGRKRPA